MSLNQKVDYLLNNGYSQVYSFSLHTVYISPSGYSMFTVGDLLYRWDSLKVI